MPDSEENKRRREQQSQHVTKGRESERHFSSILLGRIPVLTVGGDAGSLATVSKVVALSSSSVVLLSFITVAPPSVNR